MLLKKKNKFAFLAKFVVDSNGKRIGESISVYEDLLIIKRGEKFYAVPFKHVELKGEEIHIRGIIQWDRAEELARRWYAEDGNRSK